MTTIQEQVVQPEADQLRRGFQVGPWLVLPDQGLIRNDAEEVHLEPKVMDVLVYLAVHHGEVIKRDRLIDDIWKTYVSDEVLSRAISLLRSALKDDPKTPVFIQTVPKVGYRLIHPIIPVKATTAKPKSLQNRIWISVPILILFVIIIGLWGIFQKQNTTYTSFPDWIDSLDTGIQGIAQTTSIAVLPFDNLSEDSKDAYLSDGITDEITMSLSRVPGIKVVARRSSYSFKNSAEDVPSIGRMLKVDAVLEGSVRRVQDRLVINTQLSNVTDGYILWTKSYEKPLEQVFNLQGEIAAEVAAELQRSLGGVSLPAPREVTHSPPNMIAYQLYLNGRFLWKLRGEHALRNSIQMFREAVSADPEFLRTRLALANSLVLLPFYSNEPMEAMFSEAMGEIDGIEFISAIDQSEAEAIKAFIAMHRWQFVDAEIRFRQALTLAPDNPNAYIWYSQLLANVGRYDDAITAALRAKKLDGVSPVVNDRLAISYLWVDDQEHAAEQFEIGSQLGFRNRINPGYIVFLLRSQRYLEFKAVIKALHPEPATLPHWLIDSGHLVFLQENRDMASELAKQAETAGQLSMPMLQLGMLILIGDVDHAYEKFADFQRKSHRKYIYPEFLFTKEAIEFRQDPRFNQLTVTLGLDDYWAKFGPPDYLKQ